MPYRSIFITVVTVLLALLAAGMWVRSVAPMLAVVNASTQPSTEPGNTHPAALYPPTQPGKPEPERPDRQFKSLFKAILIATFLIVCLLFVIGFFTTLRTWMRAPKPKRTRYVDAWKLAGERLKAGGDTEDKSEPRP